MKTLAAALTAGILLLPMTATSQPSNHSFSVHATSIGGAIVLNGGGSYDPLTGFLQGGGGFQVTSDINGGPLAGLRAGDVGHWDASTLLPSSGFKCGAPGELAKTATTDDDTVVLQASFFRDGGAPLTAKVFVSAQDEDLVAPGSQNVWIQGVGCDDAQVNVR